MSREAMKMALDALENSHANEPIWKTPIKQAIEALRAALAQPEPEPVAWAKDFRSSQPRVVTQLKYRMGCEANEQWLPLYTAPPQRKPLSDEQIEDVFFAMGQYAKVDLKEFARAIEAAHGIG